MKHRKTITVAFAALIVGALFTWYGINSQPSTIYIPPASQIIGESGV